jgi:hypothetical protein
MRYCMHNNAPRTRSIQSRDGEGRCFSLLLLFSFARGGMILEDSITIFHSSSKLQQRKGVLSCLFVIPLFRFGMSSKGKRWEIPIKGNLGLAQKLTNYPNLLPPSDLRPAWGPHFPRPPPSPPPPQTFLLLDFVAEGDCPILIPPRCWLDYTFYDLN